MGEEFVVAFALGGIYLAAHLLLYVFVLRHMKAFQTERGIFLYHFVSAVLFSLVALAACVIMLSDNRMALWLGLVAAHGIYSLSFLELWSLAQGGYSLSILSGVAARGSATRNSLIQGFSRIGDDKKDNRLAALAESSLVERDGAHWQLTGAGRLLARCLKGLTWLSNVKAVG